MKARFKLFLGLLLMTLVYACQSDMSGAEMASAVSSGQGGSMARFTIVGDKLYTVDYRNLRLFDLGPNPANPTMTQNLNIGVDIETIFPYNNHLFIGSMNGMYIYDITDRNTPLYVSLYEHVRACDPVVVKDNYAYVTLRASEVCGGTINILEVIDITDLRDPWQVAEFEMRSPYGLAIHEDKLFLCEGDGGLKVFDAQNPSSVGLPQNMLNHIADINAYDVIAWNQFLIMTGDNGIYQYNVREDGELIALSHIPVGE